MIETRPILEVEKLVIAFGGLTAVKSLSLHVRRGSVSALIGPNGAGKSTVVNALSGFVRPKGGTIRVEGHQLVGKRVHQIARAGIARTFQNIRLFGGMTVRETLMTGAHCTLQAGFWELLLRSASARREEAEALERAEYLLNFVGLPKAILDRGTGTLSYGQQRRVEIGRALMSDPKLLLLDEPIAGMTVSEKREIGDLILKLREDGMTILLIEHDMQVVRRLAEHVTVLHHGERLADGSPLDVLADERVRLAYLGRTA